jgi:protein involved in polysaccharide export with SLBB domain
VRISGFGVADKTVFLRENQSLFDLIFESVSYDELEFQSKVLSSRLDLKRFDPATGLYNLTQFSLNNLEVLKTTFLQSKDQIVLYTKSVTKDISPTIRVLGMVLTPGEIPLSNKMYVEDAILAAGGFLEDAEKSFVNVNRLNRDLEKGTYSKLEVYQLDLDYMLGIKKLPSIPFVLENKDIISVAAPNRASIQPIVTIQGEVNYPQKVIIESDQIGLTELVRIAGGFTNVYNLESSYIVRDSLKLNFDIKEALDKNKPLILDGDVLVIGSKLSSVKTIGGVNNPSVFNWSKGKRAKAYIQDSGGKKKRIKNMYVVQANGKSEKISLFKNPKIYPGAQIIVTEKLEKNKDNDFMDDFLKIFGIVTGTLTTVVLATKL